MKTEPTEVFYVVNRPMKYRGKMYARGDEIELDGGKYDDQLVNAGHVFKRKRSFITKSESRSE